MDTEIIIAGGGLVGNAIAIALAQGGIKVVVIDPLPREQQVAAAFDGAELARLIRWAQTNGPDYTYAAFCDRVTAAGCAGYLVSLPGRRVVYFGRTAETHVEHFPA